MRLFIVVFCALSTFNVFASCADGGLDCNAPETRGRIDLFFPLYDKKTGNLSDFLTYHEDLFILSNTVHAPVLGEHYQDNLKYSRRHYPLSLKTCPKPSDHFSSDWVLIRRMMDKASWVDLGGWFVSVSDNVFVVDYGEEISIFDRVVAEHESTSDVLLLGVKFKGAKGGFKIRVDKENLPEVMFVRNNAIGQAFLTVLMAMHYSEAFKCHSVGEAISELLEMDADSFDQIDDGMALLNRFSQLGMSLPYFKSRVRIASDQDVRLTDLRKKKSAQEVGNHVFVRFKQQYQKMGEGHFKRVMKQMFPILDEGVKEGQGLRIN